MAKQEKAKIVMPADLYDTIEFAALAFGGIGAGRDFEPDEELRCPVCVHGLARVAGAETTADGGYLPNELNIQLEDLGIGRVQNDIAVEAINRRRGGRPTDARVTFRAWAKELNIVRGG